MQESSNNSTTTTSTGKLLLLFVALIGYFAIWAFLRPPYQSPGEFAHHVRVLSMPDHPWALESELVTIPGERANPLLRNPVLRFMAGYPRRKISEERLDRLKNVPWGLSVSDNGLFKTESYSYPPLYYWTEYILGNSITKLLTLTPYQSSFAYRIASAFGAALLWIWVYQLLRSVPSRNWVFAAIVLNPMLAFMSSSISPDAFFNPLAVATILYFYRLLIGERVLPYSVIALLLALFIKPTGLLLATALLVVAFALFLYRLSRKEPVLPLLRIVFYGVVAPALFAHVAFYTLSPFVMLSTEQPVFLSMAQFLAELRFHIGSWVSGVWGALGLSEVVTKNSWYIGIWAVALLNSALLFLWVKKQDSATSRFYDYLFTAGVIYAALIVAVEYAFLPIVGWSMDGRQFLPALLPLAAALSHNHKPAKVLFIALLLALNLELGSRLIHRYFKEIPTTFISSISL